MKRARAKWWLLGGLLILNTSGSFDYTFPGSGACGDGGATLYGTLSYTLKRWTSGKTTFTYTYDTMVVSQAGVELGHGHDGGMTSGGFPLPVEDVFHNVLVCQGSGAEFAYSCGVHLGPDGATFTGICF